jgi:signal recognition particle receptor subunit beta
MGREGSGKSTYVDSLDKLLKGVRLLHQSNLPPTTTKMTPIRLPGQMLLFEELGGNKRTMDNSEIYFKSCNHVIWMIDSTDPIHLIIESVRLLVEKLKIKEKDIPLLYNKPVLILLNKERSFDLMLKQGSLTKKEIEKQINIEFLKGWNMDEEPNDFQVGWIDAVNGDGVIEWTKWIADQLDYHSMSTPAQIIKSVQSFEL